METRRDVFQAISDPTRREIIAIIARKGQMNLNGISEHFEVTRPAISNHIKILAECGIIQVDQIGRERYCKIKPNNLKELSDWIGQFNALWEKRIDSFEKYVVQLNAKRKKHGRSK